MEMECYEKINKWSKTVSEPALSTVENQVDN